ncbi:hypothetical protein KAU18_05985 [Candidatus Bathyarchaeota archaeon]|nr:hypothetical protein [Candidatus Bathyarchaeota archaeon]MCK4702061.1 hypothetical protein [Candidatus Bathyarchaeota archaeon]
MNQTDDEEPTALTKALQALSKVLSYEPKFEPRASAVNEPPQPARR